MWEIKTPNQMKTKKKQKQALNTASSWTQDTVCVEILDHLTETPSWMKDVGTLLSYSQDITCVVR